MWRRRRPSEDEFRQEIETHISIETDRLIADGATPTEAARRARLIFGNTTRAREQYREASTPLKLADFGQGIRYALRIALRQRSYLLMVVSIVGLTVGVNLVVFTMVNALWLKKPTFPTVDRTVVVLGDDSVSGAGALEFAISSLDLFERSGAFEALAGQVPTGPGYEDLLLRLQFSQVADEVETLGVTPSYFDFLGLAIRGRTFSEAEDRTGTEPVAIISDRLWTRAFGRRPDVIGTVVSASPVSVRIIGVAPPGFQGARLGERTDVWVPRGLVAQFTGVASVLVLGHLHDGVTIAEAERRIAVAFSVLRNPGRRKVLVPITDVFGSPTSRMLVVRERGAATLVMFLSGLVLLAGAATLMALVLVHYERRRQELSLRLALGASRTRLVTHLSAEMLVLMAIGCVVAVLVAAGGLRALPALSLPGGADLARLDLSIDWRVLAIGILLSAATVGLAALVPIGRFTRDGLARDLVTAPGTVTLASHRLRRTLLGIDVAATVLVLMLAALFVRAVLSGFSGGLGFDVDRTVFVKMPLVKPSSPRRLGAPPREESMALMEQAAKNGPTLYASLGSLPGVESLSLGDAPIRPDLSAPVFSQRVVIDGGERNVRMAVAVVGPEYLSTLGVPMVLGRSLTAADRTASRVVPAVITTSLAQTFWPGLSPLGRVFAMPARRGTYVVVGVAAEFRYGSATGEPAGVAVTPLPAFWGGVFEAIIRTDRPETLVEPIRQRAASIVPNVRIEVVTGRELLMRDLGRQRLGAWFFSGFGLVALLLAVGGVFGLVAYLAEARQREFGVRLALGATSRHLIQQAIATILTPVALGSACGLIAAALVARSVSALLVGVSPLDPLSYVTVGMLMIGSTVLAGLLAAWRLRGLSPSNAFRAE